MLVRQRSEPRTIIHHPDLCTPVFSSARLTQPSKQHANGNRDMLILQVQAPAMYVPTDEQFWSKEDPTKPDIAFLKNHFYREGRLTEAQALYILEK